MQLKQCISIHKICVKVTFTKQVKLLCLCIDGKNIVSVLRNELVKKQIIWISFLVQEHFLRQLFVEIHLVYFSYPRLFLTYLAHYLHVHFCLWRALWWQWKRLNSMRIHGIRSAITYTLSASYRSSSRCQQGVLIFKEDLHQIQAAFSMTL